jgi:hypothetical protein
LLYITIEKIATQAGFSVLIAKNTFKNVGPNPFSAVIVPILEQ